MSSQPGSLALPPYSHIANLNWWNIVVILITSFVQPPKTLLLLLTLMLKCDIIMKRILSVWTTSINFKPLSSLRCSVAGEVKHGHEGQTGPSSSSSKWASVICHNWNFGSCTDPCINHRKHDTCSECGDQHCFGFWILFHPSASLLGQWWTATIVGLQNSFTLFYSILPFSPLYILICSF